MPPSCLRPAAPLAHADNRFFRRIHTDEASRERGPMREEDAREAEDTVHEAGGGEGSGVGIKGEKPLTAARTTEQRSTTHEEGNRIQLHSRKALVGGAYQRTADAGRERLMQHVT